MSFNRHWPTAAAQLVVAMAIAAPLFAQDAPYTDARGEEVFGPGYLPRSPADAGQPLEIGRPSAGYRVTERDLTLHYSARLSALRDAPTQAPPTPIPLLKRFGGAAEPPRRGLAPGRVTARTRRAVAQPRMTAHFVDVGQGAGAILEFPCGVAVIDSGGEYGGGAGKVDGGKAFADYLERFFAARPALRRTIDVIFTTHPHKDHLAGLARLLPRFRVRNVVDNGQTGTRGSLKAQTDFRGAARSAGARYSAVELARQVTATGATNAVIDPLRCAGVDPVITAFWGGRNEAVSTSTRDYTNPNDHSLLVRVDYGQASLLFTGDLMDRGAGDMIEQYRANRAAFDVDLLHVSHHGADGDTTDALLAVISPEVAVISMGDRASQAPSSAFAHGHPRRAALDVMQNAPEVVSRTRAPRTFWAAPTADSAGAPYRVTRAIYGTGWEGTIRMSIGADGSFRVLPPQ